MSNSTKILLIVIGALLLFNIFKESIFGVKKSDIESTRKQVEQRQEIMDREAFPTIYFLGLNSQNQTVFKGRKRVIDKGDSMLKLTMAELLAGPSVSEKAAGYYTEIPSNTKLLSIEKTASGTIINLSSAFEQGGGADSLYSRIKQLIKTAKSIAPDEDIYLYIEGKQADVLGGEGLIITQPLDENSLDG